jgi:hypothetical protein
MRKKTHTSSTITITWGVPANIRCIKNKPASVANIYINYVSCRDIYLQELAQLSVENFDTLDISYLKDLLDVAQYLLDYVRQLPHSAAQRETLRAKAVLYGELADDIKLIVTNSKQVIHVAPAQEDIVALYTLMLVLYGRTLVELEKIVALERKYFKIMSCTSRYIDKKTEKLFAAILRKIIGHTSANTQELFNLIRQRVNAVQH